jgi:hypothetical protein
MKETLGIGACIPKAEKKEGRDHMLNIPKNGKGPCRVSQ